MLFAPKNGAKRPSSRRRHQRRGKLDSKALLRLAKEHDRITVAIAVVVSAVLAAWLAGLAAG